MGRDPHLLESPSPSGRGAGGEGLNIEIAQHAGFCSGVERAYKIAVETSKRDIPVFVLGYLVHNSFVIKKLGSLGVKSVSSISEIPDRGSCVLIISAHGVGPEIYDQAKCKNLEVVDTTCSWVKKAQSIAHDLAGKGYKILIVGDKNHTEVKGIMEWAGDNNALIIEGPADIDVSVLPEKIAVIAQTTQSQENFDNVVKKIKLSAKELVVHNTICGATSKRQSSAVELAKRSDLMLVIGDQKSANTKRLKELCEKTGTMTFQIQDEGEIRVKWLEGKKNVGITAGASTPAEIISQVVNKIKA